MGAPPESLIGIASRVDSILEDLLEAESARWADLDPALAEPIGEISRLVRSGGKRLRPAFCHWGFIAAGGAVAEAERGDSPVALAGAALELLHAQALFHDDIIDDADSRRGAPTTHQVLAARHRAGGWAGESRRFGEGLGILVGDLAGVYADRILGAQSAETRAVWDELRIEVDVGQLLDVLGSAVGDRSLERAERVCRYKSAKYSIERPLHLGASLAGGSATVNSALSDYGLPLGEAFQMRDDVIGVFGDPAVTGKPVGGDLRESKPTPLMARAFAKASPAQQVVLERAGAVDLDDSEIADIQQVIVDTGALRELEGAITLRLDQAVDALDDRIDGSAIGPLTELAGFIVDRAA